MTDHRRPRLTAHDGGPTCDHQPRRQAVQWAEMSLPQRFVAVVVLGCLGSIAVAATVVVIVAMARAVL